MGALVMLFAQAAAGAVGAVSEAQKKAVADSLIRKAQDRYGSVDLAKIQTIIAEEMGPAVASHVKADPAVVAAQKQALDKMSAQVDAGGGLSMEDRASQNEALGASAIQERAGRGAINNQMQARGTADSGTALAMSLSNTQAAADRGGTIGLQTAAASQKRYLDSILKQGQMAGDMRRQGFDEDFRTADARDKMNEFNARARQRAQDDQNRWAQQRYTNAMDQAKAANDMDMKAAGMANADAAAASQSAAGWGAAAGQVGKAAVDAYGRSGSGSSASAGKDSSYDPIGTTDEWGNPYKDPSKLGSEDDR